MTRGKTLAEKIDAAILVDEVGIETGRHGPFRLKTLYQPVFRNIPAGLAPCGVTGTTQAQHEGQPISMQTFLAELSAEDCDFVDCLCRALHLRNHANIGVDGLTLFLDCNQQIYGTGQVPPGAFDYLMSCLDEIDFDPALLVCEFANGDEAGQEDIVQGLRHRGIRLAIGDFGMSQTSLSRISLLDPEVIKIERAFFHRIADIPTAARLLALLIDALRREGRHVFITGIEKQEHLRVALESGADFLQGQLLGGARIAGAIFDTTPFQPSTLLSSDEKVIPLFGNHSREP
ncbi:EAL domain-containing protein [Chelativorans sp. YIM 93263]|uniref:EAL domain-containing protein n=1 Tax=Chelativorans sp. YIM 93263 TaxID=2906648 RepID=UPI0023799005|nr:EAL domain-containing protein [Chelativorans sp. YIM 93263]